MQRHPLEALWTSQAGQRAVRWPIPAVTCVVRLKHDAEEVQEIRAVLPDVDRAAGETEAFSTGTPVAMEQPGGEHRTLATAARARLHGGRGGKHHAACRPAARSVVACVSGFTWMIGSPAVISFRTAEAVPPSVLRWS
jgi:hypothetical protein